jgi:nucleoside-diphosphate-sugar epimerase
MKILVTGAAGYIGSVLVGSLLERGWSIVGLDNLSKGGGGLLGYIPNPRFSFINGDVRDIRVLEAALADCDVVIHLAAIVGFPACRANPLEARSINVDGTRALMDAVHRCGSGDLLVLYGSTGSNYGALEQGVCNENTPLNPLSLYGITKTEAEQIVMQRASSVAYRFATAFGVSPRMRIDLLVNELVYLATTQGHMVVYESSFMRTFIHVRDIADAFVHAILNASCMKGNIYNVGSNDMNFSKRSVASKIGNKTGAYVHFADVGSDADKRNYVVDYSKISSSGYSTRISMDDGIEELIKAFSLIRVENPMRNA